MPQTITCASCTECTNYLTNGTLSPGDTLRLTADITNYAGADDGTRLGETCISFGGKEHVSARPASHSVAKMT